MDDREREQRIRYNEEAVKQAGEFHAQRYRGLIAGAEMPPALAAGGRIGMIGVSDDIRERIPANCRYTPRTLVPMVNGVDVQLPGEARIREVGLQKDESTPKLSRSCSLGGLL